MKLVDDIRRDLTADDYEAVAVEAASLLSSFPDISLYMYGSFSPPRSDIDMAAVLPDDYPVGRIRALWAEILSFVSSSDKHRYLFKQKIKILPLSIWRQIHYIYWPINREPYRFLSGPPAPLPDAPDTPEFNNVGLLDRLFNDVQGLLTLQFSSSVSLRNLLSRFYK